jgi:thioredoxin-dependent peroxiredoxin
MTARTTIKKGQTLTLLGPEIRVGQTAPAFKLKAIDFSDVELSQTKGKVRLLSVVHSLDTSVCDLQTQRFEQEAGKFQDIIMYTISMDLPFAQERYCGAHDIKNLKTLSDYFDASFGQAYGVLIKEQRLLSRAIFIIDGDDIVRYVEYVPEVGHSPDYDKAIAALKKIVSRSVKEPAAGLSPSTLYPPYRRTL